MDKPMEIALNGQNKDKEHYKVWNNNGPKQYLHKLKEVNI